MSPESMSTAVSSPIFIVGTPRSGTTLTARILGRSPRLFMPGETHFMHDIFARRASIGNPTDPGAQEKILKRLVTLYKRYNSPVDQERVEHLFSLPETIERFHLACTNYGSIFSFLMMVQAESMGKVRWGNNAPKDVFHIKDILALYPDAKILMCVRDVRDFLLSYKGKWRVTSTEHENRIRNLYHPVSTSLLWKATMRLAPEIRALVPQQNFMIVQYEELVRHPRETVQKICETIGEPYSDDLLNVSTKNSSSQVQQPGIFSSSVGRWREGLTPEEIWIAQRLTHDEMGMFEYEIEPVRVNFLTLSRSILGFPVALFRALHANRRDRGPLLPYIARRAKSILIRSR